MALTINRLGMALMRMGQVSDSVRFLDETDMTFSLDSRTSAQEHMTSMELSMKPIVFRASYRDINLIMAIVNKAISLYGESASPSPSPSATAVTHSLKSTSGPQSKYSARMQVRPVGQARVLMSKEQVESLCFFCFPSLTVCSYQ